MSEQPTDKIKKIAQPIIEQEDMFLVDIEVMHEKKMEVWILVDSETGGVNLDACSKISRKVGFILEEENVINGAYRLNVSSPGLSRPLTDKRQYAKNSGRLVKVKYKENDEYKTVEGILADVEPGQIIEVVTDDDSRSKIMFSDVVETKVIPKI